MSCEGFLCCYEIIKVQGSVQSSFTQIALADAFPFQVGPLLRDSITPVSAPIPAVWKKLKKSEKSACTTSFLHFTLLHSAYPTTLPPFLLAYFASITYLLYESLYSPLDRIN